MKPSQIIELRQIIDSIDDEIMELISKRIELSTRIMKLKSDSQVIDPAREQAIINRYFAKLSAQSTMTKVKRLVLGVIRSSGAYPEQSGSSSGS